MLLSTHEILHFTIIIFEDDNITKSINAFYFPDRKKYLELKTKLYSTHSRTSLYKYIHVLM